ncbi:chorismate--pyruvate lyase family protein [Marinobacterium weihaiense]|uniref:Probable chorismate pyruvate-lyase n=1 Tax=Marinobacterium weihaiense TaxID=2851016 RepID=A0ABS6MAI0_9GAMM|nr:chorismate lyase [Marinobacterium weihaiense]MBV0933235.1 chorismate lyase [Marinobacterium weihaiense]
MSARTALLAPLTPKHWTLAEGSHAAPHHWRPWLQDRGSLTQRLTRAAGGEFAVRVLAQRWDTPTADEARALGMPPRQLALIREVELLGRNGTPWVYARSVLPAATLTGRERRLTLLGNRSLGSLMFSDPSLTRSPLMACCLRDEDRQHYWARRSVFRLHGKPLLVCEVFLPEMEHVQYPL